MSKFGTMRVTVTVPVEWVEKLMAHGWSKTAALKLVRSEVERKAQDAVDFSALVDVDEGEPRLEAI